MKLRVRSYSFRQMTAVVAAIVAFWVGTEQTATAQVKDDSRAGMIYFIGVVESVTDGVAHIDLGTAHKLKEGDQLAIFRLRDSVFIPVGNLEVAECDAIRTQSQIPVQFVPMRGDIAIYVRTISDLRSPQFHTREVLKLTSLATRGNNSYTTIRQQDVAAALLDIRRQFPKWQRSRERIVGAVRGSNSGHLNERVTERLLMQIDQYRRLEENGVPVVIGGPHWDNAMTVLRQPVEELRIQAAAIVGAVDSETEAAADSSAEPDQRDVNLRQAVGIRTNVEEVLFDRSPEIRHLATVLCAAMNAERAPNEKSWMTIELEQSQFPQLAQDEQFMVDLEIVMSKYRAAAGDL